MKIVTVSEGIASLRSVVKKLPLSLGRVLARNVTTFVDVLRESGYFTGLVGKCRLQNMTDMAPEVPRDPTPTGKQAPPAHLSDAVKDRWHEGGYDMELIRKWREDREHRVALPYYGFDQVDLATMHGDLVEGDYARWLEAQCGSVRYSLS